MAIKLHNQHFTTSCRGDPCLNQDLSDCECPLKSVTGPSQLVPYQCFGRCWFCYCSCRTLLAFCTASTIAPLQQPQKNIVVSPAAWVVYITIHGSWQMVRCPPTRHADNSKKYKNSKIIDKVSKKCNQGIERVLGSKMAFILCSDHLSLNFGLIFVRGELNSAIFSEIYVPGCMVAYRE